MTQLAKARHALGEAVKWAETTLEEAGLPSFVGSYTLGPDGKSLVPAPPEMIGRETDRGDLRVRFKPDVPVDAPWVLTLPHAIERVGHAIESPEWQAAQLLYELARVEQRVRQVNASAAAFEAFYAGMRWQRQQMHKSDEGRRRVLAGAKKAAAANVKHDPADKMRWVFADRLLERDGTINGVLVEPGGMKSAHQRADLLAPRFNVEAETFRKEVRKIRQRTDPKK
jgi:hypothetical protein